MSKDSQKAIKARLTNEIAAKYKGEILIEKNRCRELLKRNRSLILENDVLKNKIIDLEDKLRTHEDWIERLSDFCNMTETDRKDYLEKIRAERQASEKFTSMFEGIFEFGGEYWSEYLKTISGII